MDDTHWRMFLHLGHWVSLRLLDVRYGMRIQRHIVLLESIGILTRTIRAGFTQQNENDSPTIDAQINEMEPRDSFARGETGYKLCRVMDRTW